MTNLRGMAMSINVASIDNGQEEVRVGEFVGFKDDIEQYGKLIRIEGSWLVLSVFDGETGDRYEVKELASRCWKA